MATLKEHTDLKNYEKYFLPENNAYLHLSKSFQTKYEKNDASKINLLKVVNQSLKRFFYYKFYPSLMRFYGV